MALRLRSAFILKDTVKTISSKSLQQTAKLSISSSTCLMLRKKTNQNILLNAKVLLFNNNKRLYASDQQKLAQAQIEEKVLNIFKNFDRIKENPAKLQVTLDSHVIKDLGLDSLDHVEIIVQLEDTFGFEIPDSDYEKLYTPKEIVNYLSKKVHDV